MDNPRDIPGIVLLLSTLIDYVCMYVQLHPSKTADSPIHAIKRSIFDSLWLIPGKCYAIFFANPNRYRLDLSKEISYDSEGQ